MLNLITELLPHHSYQIHSFFVISSNYAVSSTSDFHSPPRLVFLKILTFNHMGSMENPSPLPQTRHKRPWLPFDLWKHGWDSPYVRRSSVKADVIGPRHTSPCSSFLVRVVGSVREVVSVLVRNKAQVGYSRSRYDQGSTFEYRCVIWKNEVRPFGWDVLWTRITCTEGGEMGTQSKDLKPSF